MNSYGAYRLPLTAYHWPQPAAFLRTAALEHALPDASADHVVYTVPEAAIYDNSPNHK
jgi:hypothetical protein